MKNKKEVTGMNLPQRARSIEKKYGHNILTICPDSALYDVQTTCVIVLDAVLPVADFFVKFLNPCKSTFVHAERLSDTTLSFKSPGNFPAGDAKITIHHGAAQTKLCIYTKQFVFKSKLELAYELLQTSSDPMLFIANAYNINESDSVAIDFKLEHALRINMPTNFNILQNKGDNDCKNKTAFSSLNNPTLLHFAARYNLVRLFVKLLDCPGAQEASRTANKDGHSPGELADICGNSHLGELLSSTLSDEKDLQARSPSVDEIYEHMSAEIYERYIEVKKDFEDEVYEDMNNVEEKNELYEDMYTCRRESSNSRASIPLDRQSVYSSDSAVSSASNDSRGSAFGLSRSESPAPPPIPPSDYKRPNKTIPNPLISELKRKTEEKRSGLVSEEPVEAYVPPRSPLRSPLRSQPNNFIPPARPQKSPRGKTSLINAFNQEVYNLSQNSNNETIEEVYDTPPPRRSYVSDDDDDYESFDDTNELYDTPPTRSTDAEELYDVPKSHGAVEEEVYDVPPSTQTPAEVEVFKLPPSGEELYDVPPSTEEVYDVPPNKYLQEDTVYDTPPTGSFEEDEIYDDISPLKEKRYSSEQDLLSSTNHISSTSNGRNIPALGRIGKRFSEPALSLSTTEQQRLIRGGIGMKPLLPPPNLPPPRRNVNNVINAPKITARPPPLPPHRR